MHHRDQKITIRWDEGTRQGAQAGTLRAQEAQEDVPRAHRLLSAALHVHNGPAQYLAGALAQLRLLQRRIPVTLPEAHASLRASIASTQAALDSAREIIRLLHAPERGTRATLAQRLHEAIKKVRPLTEAELSVDTGGLDRLPRTMEAGLSDVAHEALANAARHAAAQHICVGLRQVDHKIVLEVQDDGRGLGRSGRDHGGLGLMLMRDQVRLLGGRLTITRRPGGGTVVRAIVPASPAERTDAAASASGPSQWRAARRRARRPRGR
jgi:signal transduction histidine kinase